MYIQIFLWVFVSLSGWAKPRVWSRRACRSAFICWISTFSWYKYGNEDVKPYKIRIQPPLPNDPQKTRRYYESKLAAYLDVIDVAAIVDFTGYNRHTVCEWIRFGKLRALALQHKYMIPKCYLIDWLSSDEHNATLRKSRRHIDRLWELQKWSDGQ